MLGNENSGKYLLVICIIWFFNFLKYYIIVVIIRGGGEECFYIYNLFIYKGMFGWYYLVICICLFIYEMFIVKLYYFLNNIEIYMILCKYIYRNWVKLNSIC